MGTRYLTDLARILRNAGLSVVEVSGWQTRARSSGGYDGNPEALMLHHTASALPAYRDVQLMTFELQYAPIANLYVARDEVVHVMAGGATNTNGRGGPLGTIPKDGMNRRAIGVEIANRGTGEPYTAGVQDVVMTLSKAITRAYRIEQVFAHHEWAPGRKIDPAGPSRWSPDGGLWNMDLFRTELFTAAPPPQPPPVPGDDEDMKLYAAREANGNVWVGNGIHRQPMTSADEWNLTVLRSRTGAGPKVHSAGGNGAEIVEPGEIHSGPKACEMTAEQLTTLGDWVR